MKLAICPGSFDPVTIGHLDIIGRARKIFDHVIVAVMVNPEKHTMFTTEERIALIQKCTKDMEDVEVVSFDGLLADYAKMRGATAIVKDVYKRQLRQAAACVSRMSIAFCGSLSRRRSSSSSSVEKAEDAVSVFKR